MTVKSSMGKIDQIRITTLVPATVTLTQRDALDASAQSFLPMPRKANLGSGLTWKCGGDPSIVHPPALAGQDGHYPTGHIAVQITLYLIEANFPKRSRASSSLASPPAQSPGNFQFSAHVDSRRDT